MVPDAAAHRSQRPAGGTARQNGDVPATAIKDARAQHWLRAVSNLVNLSTPLGLLVAAGGRSSVRLGPELLVVCEGYRLPLPKAGAFTIGNVVLVPRGTLAGVEGVHPGTLGHEARHSSQYAWSLGLPFLAAYALASGWSWLRTGDAWSRNWFERNAGLAHGGYVEKPADNAGLRRIGRGLRLSR